MAELTFKSAGVSTREIDLSGPTAIKPQGVPAGVIGTAQKGPAFVPVTVATWKDFVAEFGGTDGKKFGPLAMNEWMKNARAGTFIRVLGVGDAAKRDSDTGQVSNAGFVVGAELPQNTDVHDGGQLGLNPYANESGDAQSQAGRTYFLGAMMRESYAMDGESAASARVSITTPLDPTQLATSDTRGEALQFVDAAGDTATVWVHEGADNTSSAGEPLGAADLLPLENGKNRFVSAGARGTLVISVDEEVAADLHNKMIELTDVAGNKFIGTFDDTVLTAATDWDTGIAGQSIIGISDAGNKEAIATSLSTAIGLCIAAGGIDFTASITDNNITLQTTVFGNPADEPDGGAFLGGHLSTENTSEDPTDRTDLDTWGGDNPTAAELVDRIVAVSSAFDAALTFSRDGDTLVVTQDTAGLSGNFGVGTATISHDGEHAVHTLTVNTTGSGIPDADAFQIVDVAGNTLDITFVDSGDADAASNEVSVGAAEAATATFTQQGVDPRNIAGDVIELIDNSGTPVTLTISYLNAGDAGDHITLTDDTGADFSMAVTVDCQHADHATSDAVTTLAAAINIARDAPDGVAADAGFRMEAVVAGNDVVLTQEDAGAAGNSTITLTGPTDADDWLTLPSDFTGGRDEPGLDDIAGDIEALIIASTLEVAVERDVALITLTQQEGGEHLLATCFVDGTGTPIGDTVLLTSETDAGTDFEEFDDAEPATSGGTPVAGLTDSILNFSGGADDVEGDVAHTHWLDAGLDTSSAGLDRSVPIIRAVLMTPQGVHPTLACHNDDRIASVAANSEATLTLTGTTLADGDTLTITDSAGDSAVITVAAAGGGGALTLDNGDGTFTLDTDQGSWAAGDANGMLGDAITTAAIGITSADDGDDLTLTHTLIGAIGDSATVTGSFTDSGIDLGEFEGGADASADAHRAAVVKGEETSNGSQVGLVQIAGTQERFTLLLNGHIDSSEFPSELTCSFDPQAPDYFMNILNHDAACMEKAGHYVYAHYNVTQDIATVSGHGNDDDSGDPEHISAPTTASAFLVHGRTSDLTGAGVEPCYEDFQDRFRTAKSPWVISQVYGAKPKNLFRIHALDDGTAGSGKFKISIANILMGSAGGHGTFDLHVRDITDDDIAPRVYEKFLGLDLNPQSDRYIARVIGDQYMYYDFDKRPGSQKLVVDGIHPARSKYIRVEMDPRVDSGGVPNDALPMGYRGYHHLNTDANGFDGAGLRFLQDGLQHCASLGSPAADAGSVLNDAVEPPVPVRTSIASGTGPKKRAMAQLHWGTHFQVIDDIDEPNKNTKFNDSVLSYGKYYPTLRANSTSSQPDVSVGDNWGAQGIAEATDGAEDWTSVQDADVFNNNMFSLERIQIISKQPSAVSSKNPNVKGKADHKQWAAATYRRNGVLDGSITTLEGLNVFQDGDATTGNPHADVTADGSNNIAAATSFSRFLDPQTDMVESSTRRYAKFSFFLQGGFDGANIFNKEKRNLTNRAAVWEMDDADQGGVDGCTVASFRKAIDVMAEKADVDIKLLTIPGMRDEAVTDYAIDAVEDRFDAMYIMDIEEKSVQNELMIDYSSQKPSVNLTVEDLAGRNIDSSFAAAYFPDVVITDPALGINVQCPPSVAVLGAFSLNDSVAHPWFAPAGFSRGALKSVVETQVKLSRKNLDTLYESDVNPLAAFPHTPGVVVWGQKTLQQAQSALDRVNVRRLLIEVRREVRRVGNNLLFEPNREETLGRFSAAVNPILQRIQQQQGLDKFKVVIDTTTTTQADIENNTVRGKIFLQPTRTVEFISLDFVVTNAGMEV